MRVRTLCLFIICAATYAFGQDRLWQLHYYDETNSALEGHTTQILQDHSGLLWIATWNGIYRFDGYDFRRMKPQPGDSCSMTSDRIRDIWLAKNGDIYVKNDETLFLFDTKTYHFRNLHDEDELREAEQQRDKQPTRGKFVDGRLEYIDPQGLEWLFHNDALYCMSSVAPPIKPMVMEKQTMVRCLKMDSKKRVWMTTKEDATVRLLDTEGHTLGYLSPDGTLSPHYRSFGHPVYCITETHDGHIWMGCKPGGLLRLTEKASTPNRFTIESINGLESTDIYGVAEDSRHRLWIATLGNGIACIEQPNTPQPYTLENLPGYPTDICQRVRHIHITSRDELLAATTEGLIVANLANNAKDTRFLRRTKDPADASSLSCNAVMDVVETTDNRIFIATETGGICELLSTDLTADTLHFRSYDMASGLLPTDMTLGMTLMPGNHLLVVSNTKLISLDLNHGTFESLGHHFFRHVYHFSEARPLLLPNDNWLVGTNEGAFLLPASSAHHSNYQPPLLLTGISYANNQQQLAVTHIDTLQLKPSERSLTLHFAALDYIDPTVINYQYRLGTDSTSQWINLGHSHSITLLDLLPGNYLLSVRSTNVDGLWTNNTRTLTIIVEPMFWETVWAQLLLAILLLAVIGAIVYTFIYIRAINRKQRETLEKYLELLNNSQAATATTANDSQQQAAPLSAVDNEQTTIEKVDDPFMQRVLQYVEQNLANGDADIGQMAEACYVSRSVLQRKLKQLMGVTPIDFMREARLKHACKMLRTTDLTVSDVAYQCGFNDPKYFSRCFRQSVGMSPTEYKQQSVVE